MGLVSEDRKAEGLALGRSIEDNLTYSGPAAGTPGAAGCGWAGAGPRWRAGWSGCRSRRRGPAQAVGELSGGNQQKVAIARLLHQQADVLLLDEPTRGIDVGSKAEIYRLIGELAAEGKAILVVSSYLPELFGICDRIAVMTRGGFERGPAGRGMDRAPRDGGGDGGLSGHRASGLRPGPRPHRAHVPISAAR